MKKDIPFQMDRGDTDSRTWYLPDGAIARFGKGNVMDMVLSPDGTLLAIGSYLGLWWYDVPNRSLLTLWEAGKTVTTVAFSACGEWVATGGWGAPMKIWDVKSGNCLAEIARDKSGYATDIVFSSDRKRLVVGGSTRHSNPEKRLYCSVEVWRLPENLQDSTVTVHPEREAIYVGTNPIALSPDNRLLALLLPMESLNRFTPMDTQSLMVDGYWLQTVLLCMRWQRVNISSLWTD